MLRLTLTKAIAALASLASLSRLSPVPNLNRDEDYLVARTALTTVLSIARTRVRTTPFQLVDASTLRAYTDASLLLGVLDLLSSTQTRETRTRTRVGKRTDKMVLEAIRTLDMATIVAGAVGPGREWWVWRVIGCLQARLREGEAAESGESREVRGTRTEVAGKDDDDDEGEDNDEDKESGRQPKRPRLDPSSPSSTSPTELQHAPMHIPSIPPPTLESYAALSDRPFVIRGYLSHDTHHPRWPALERWKSRSYLLDAVGPGRVVPVELGKSYDEQGWSQRIVSFESFLDAAGWPREDGTGTTTAAADDSEVKDDNDDLKSQPVYLAQHTLFKQFPALERDFSWPEYAFSGPPPPEGYTAPNDVLVNVWIGPGGRRVVSPAHTVSPSSASWILVLTPLQDPFFNCYAQVLGRKRVWVAPPECGAYMSAYGKHDGEGEEGQGEDTLAAEYMTNTSTVPILRDVELAALKARFPKWYEHVYPRAMETVLYPGDLMVMPPRWWHAMRGEGDDMCWSVSFWY